MRPFAQSRSVGAGLRSGMRRLTGGEKDRERDRSDRSGGLDPSSPIVGGSSSRKKEGDALRQQFQQRSITSPQVPQLPRLPPLPGLAGLPGTVTGTGAYGAERPRSGDP